MRRVLLIAALLGACAETPDEDPWSNWASYAGSSDSAQYSSLAQINRSNITELEVAWTYPAGETEHRSTPLVIGDVMYVVANGGVTALNAATGTEIWFAPDSVTPSVRGLAYWEEDGAGRLFAIKEHYLQALDANNGELIASFGDKGRIDLRENLGRDPETIDRIATMTPGRIFEDLIIMGSAMGDDTYGGAPGDIRAYDVRTGELVWTFHTIPHPGEPGYETWPPNAWKTIGAANAWTTMSIDEERGIVFVPTGAPSYHFYGANRVGDNLFANCLIALDARTGERIWHFQTIHHDIWDYDHAMGPKLLTVERDGEQIDAVALATKQGLLFVFDRETGEAVFPIEERPVPPSDVPGEVASPTQPFPVGLPPFARLSLQADELSPYADEEERESWAERIRIARNEGLYTPPSFRGSVSAPGSRGGAQHGNAAVMPDAGLFYIAVIESPTIPKLERRIQATAEHYESASAEEIYASSCAACHGPEGRGRLPLFPALLGIAEKLSEDEFRTMVQQGGGRMSGFPDIPDEQIGPLLEYVNAMDGARQVDVDALALAASEREPYRSGYHHFFSENGLVGPLPWSHLVAYDLNKGVILWDEPYGDFLPLAEEGVTGTGSLFPTNSLTATAGGLLFSATNDKKLRAWNSDTGKVLWSADLPADPGGIPAVYEIGGTQFVVATATRNRVNEDGEFAYVAFTLGGNVP